MRKSSARLITATLVFVLGAGFDGDGIPTGKSHRDDRYSAACNRDFAYAYAGAPSLSRSKPESDAHRN